MALKLATAVLVGAAVLVNAQPDGPVPAKNANPTDTSNPRLVGKAFPYNALPYQADTSVTQPGIVYRGPQAGYNICNSTTAGPDSKCQTLIVNSLQDFCLWAPQTFAEIGEAEGEVVAYCANSTWGARPIPAGAITGMQFIKTPSYIEITGHLSNDSILQIKDGDGGGELDSGGQDNRGNPMGGLSYSLNLPSTPGVMTQSRMWHFFIGNGIFCGKWCDEKAPNASGLCRHTIDEAGCNTAVPAAYVDGQFTSCDGDDQQPVAIGVTAIPSSSNCQTFQSTDLWPVTGTTTSTSTTSTATTTGSSGSSGSKGGSGGSGTTTSSGGKSSSSSSTGGAGALRVESGALGALLVSTLALVFGAVVA